jgi:hypothetical protein
LTEATSLNGSPPKMGGRDGFLNGNSPRCARHRVRRT